MAKIINIMLRNSVVNLNCLNRTSYQIITPVRSLYAQSTLGIDNYVETRERVKSQFTSMSEKFRTKMSEYVSDDNQKNLVFTEDLKNMIHLAESNTEDLILVIKMMTKFNQQNKELRFGSFIFGPVVMRMFYHLNKPEEALECFTNPQLEGFFDQLMSYQLLLDLLYENERYDDVIKTFELIKAKQIQGTKYPKNIIVLTLAACYKKNSAESLEYALKLWAELHEVGHLPMRRAATFCAGLALKQGKPEVALEIISGIKNKNYVTVRNMKTEALAKIGRIEEALAILKSVLEIDDPNNIKHTFVKDVVECVRQAVEKQDSPDIKQEYQRIEKYLKEQGHISEVTLESHLCGQISSPAFISTHIKDRQKYVPRNQYQGQNSNRYRLFNQRPGLKDMS